ncbi:MAG: penicillin-binding protein 2 [Gammaproteobacteria bacterium]|nr:MAG: penicillin-binding protein 2 [Gammaproteobacteria bacterium]
MRKQVKIIEFPMRRWFLLSLYTICMAGLVFRAVDLQVLNKEFLQDHGDARALRVVKIPAHRGMITDRNGESLAISTPVNSIWAVPRKVMAADVKLDQLAKYLHMDEKELTSLLRDRIGRQFVYLKRHVAPVLAEQVMLLDIPGISLQREYRRYYPAAEVTSHVLGFTNIDDSGQEGIELAFDNWLKGSPGSKRVLKDRLGRIIENIESITTPDPGNELVLSIDRRVQYLAYRELKSAVNHHKARAGTLVMLDVKTGEIIAMVGQPSYNPNNRTGLKSGHYRNRAVTDVFEPGSTLKPFTIATALESGLYDLNSTIDTRPGFFKVGDHTIRDHRDYGVIDLATVIKKSSNIGASKIALSLEPLDFWTILANVGFGQVTGSGFPGEASGYLNPYNNWSEVEQATMSFGYGVSTTALQLAQAYMPFATDGMMLPVSFLKVTEPVTASRVFSAGVARQVRAMLETVVQKGGTGSRAFVEGYRVAGKTGTVHKTVVGGYSEDRYLSLFAGMAPASNPRLIAVVIIDEPKGDEYYGGLVAAPVFANVMAGALRLLDVPPDDLPVLNRQIIAAGRIN